MTTVTAPDNKAPSRNWLSKAFNFAAPAIAGMGVGFAVKTYATCMLCTAGAPAIATAIVASAGAGLVASALKETWKYHRTEKKQNANAKFWTGKRLTSLFVGATIGGAFGSLGSAYADEIKSAAETVYEKAAAGIASFSSNTPFISFITPNTVYPSFPASAPAVDIRFSVTNEVTPSILEETTEKSPEATPETVSEKIEEPAAPLPIQIIEPDIYTTQRGDNLWNIVKEHYNLTDDTDIKRYVDGTAQASNLTNGTAANNIGIGDKIILPPKEALESHQDLVLDWQALNGETKARLLAQNTGRVEIPVPNEPKADLSAIQKEAAAPSPVKDGLECTYEIKKEEIGFLCKMKNNALALIKGDTIIFQPAPR